MWSFYLGAFGALAATFLVATMGIPFIRLRSRLAGLKIRRKELAVEMETLANRLGGKRAAAEWAARYTRCPAWLAPGRENAWCLLAYGGDEALPQLRSLLRHSSPRIRTAAVRALGGTMSCDGRYRPLRLGPSAEPAAELLIPFLADPDRDVRATAETALTAAGPAPLMALDVYIRCLEAGGWKLQEAVGHGQYRALLFHNGNGEFDEEWPPPYRLVLSTRESGTELIVREWTSSGSYYHLGVPQFLPAATAGRPMLAFTQYCGGNGWGNENLRVLVLDEAPREVTPVLPGGWHARRIEDIDEDGRPELLVLVGDYEFYMEHCHATSPACWRVFKWEAPDQAFIDASADCPEFYAKSIAEHRAAMAGAPDDPWSGAPVSLLLDHWCLGRTAEGWREFKAHMDGMKPRLPPKELALVEKMEADLAKRLGLRDR
jgi:hypothetical protein